MLASHFTPLAALSLLLHSAAAASGSFNLLTYNVAGLPAWLSDNGVPGDKPTNAATIGTILGQTGHDVVHLQEDFSYNRQIFGADTAHAYRTAHSGNVPFGDGLSTLSNYQWTVGVNRVKWAECSIFEADCLTPKGFSLTRIVVEGAEIDFYNLHADAGSHQWDANARSAGIDQLLAYIAANSASRAVVLAGDFNDRWTNAALSINKLAAAGFTDPWISLVKGGVVPQPGSTATPCAVPAADSQCEIVDKVFYRSGNSVALTATAFQYPSQVFVQADGNRLSDHNPVLVDFTWST